MKLFLDARVARSESLPCAYVVSFLSYIVAVTCRLVDVATGYVTSTEVAEVVQAVVGTGTSLVDIAQSAGDAWQSGTAHILLYMASASGT
jgi:hypothetical protein